jgi:hypothetical protein
VHRFPVAYLVGGRHSPVKRRLSSVIDGATYKLLINSKKISIPKIAHRRLCGVSALTDWHPAPNTGFNQRDRRMVGRSGTKNGGGQIDGWMDVLADG